VSPHEGSGTAAPERSGLAWLAHELCRAEAWDEGIEAARNACVAGASLAAGAIAAAAYYDNPLTGAPALRECMERVGPQALALDAWREALAPRPHPAADGHPVAPGFGFVGPGREGVFFGALERWVERVPSAPRSRFLLAHRAVIEPLAGALNAAGLAALACLDCGLDADAAERRFLLLKLESALDEAQKAQRAGLRSIPFDGIRYVYEGTLPAPRARDRQALLRHLGLDERLDHA
jgi:hypothetical protein